MTGHVKLDVVLALKGNPHHHPAGSSKGGQFAPSHGSSGSMILGSPAKGKSRSVDLASTDGLDDVASESPKIRKRKEYLINTMLDADVTKLNVGFITNRHSRLGPEDRAIAHEVLTKLPFSLVSGLASSGIEFGAFSSTRYAGAFHSRLTMSEDRPPIIVMMPTRAYAEPDAAGWFKKTLLHEIGHAHDFMSRRNESDPGCASWNSSADPVISGSIASDRSWWRNAKSGKNYSSDPDAMTSAVSSASRMSYYHKNTRETYAEAFAVAASIRYGIETSRTPHLKGAKPSMKTFVRQEISSSTKDERQRHVNDISHVARTAHVLYNSMGDERFYEPLFQLYAYEGKSDMKLRKNESEYDEAPTHAYVAWNDDEKCWYALYQFAPSLTDGPGKKLSAMDTVFGVPYRDLKDGTYAANGEWFEFDYNPGQHMATQKSASIVTKENLADVIVSALKGNTKHHPAGSSKGGEFAPKTGNSAAKNKSHENDISDEADRISKSLGGPNNYSALGQMSDTFSDYIAVAYEGVNTMLRTGEQHPSSDMPLYESTRHAAALDVLINKSEASVAPLEVYRGFGLKMEDAASFLKKGQLVADRAFVSTSAQKSTMEGFAEHSKGYASEAFADSASGKKAREFAVISATIKVPKGSKMLNVNDPPIPVKGRNLNRDEEEFILPRGSVFRVVSAKKKSTDKSSSSAIKFHNYEVVLELVPSKKLPAKGKSVKKDDASVTEIEMTEPFSLFVKKEAKTNKAELERAIVSALKGNANHHPAGSSKGGEFAPSKGGGKGSLEFTGIRNAVPEGERSQGGHRPSGKAKKPSAAMLAALNRLEPSRPVTSTVTPKGNYKKITDTFKDDFLSDAQLSTAFFGNTSEAAIVHNFYRRQYGTPSTLNALVDNLSKKFNMKATTADKRIGQDGDYHAVLTGEHDIIHVRNAPNLSMKGNTFHIQTVSAVKMSPKITKGASMITKESLADVIVNTIKATLAVHPGSLSGEMVLSFKSNPNHHPAGSSKGGEFAPGKGGSKGKGGKPFRPTNRGGKTYADKRAAFSAFHEHINSAMAAGYTKGRERGFVGGSVSVELNNAKAGKFLFVSVGPKYKGGGKFDMWWGTQSTAIPLIGAKIKEARLKKADTSEHFSSIRKLDVEKQIVYGEVYAPYVVDSHGDMMLPEDVEKMAHRFMANAISRSIDKMHNNISQNAYPVESFIARADDPDFTEGAWVMGVKIEDAELWKEVKSGKINGFSLEAMVKTDSAEVEVDVDRVQYGSVHGNDGHSHLFIVEVDENGKIVHGQTTKDAGHSHEILKASATTEVNGHSHRFFLR